MRARLSVFLAFMFLILSASVAAAYDLAVMRGMNPDFTTYPDARGILWLKQTSFSRVDSGGLERAELRILLGRSGLDEKCLTWNIQAPKNGSVDITEAAVYSFETGEKIRDVAPSLGAGTQTVKFSQLPDTYIIVMAWRSISPEELTIEDVFCFTGDDAREQLTVWESILETSVPATWKLHYITFPNDIPPETGHDDMGRTVYTWRKINVDPIRADSLMIRDRPGVAFSTRSAAHASRLVPAREASGRES